MSTDSDNCAAAKGLTNGERVLWLSENVIGGGLSDESRTEQKDLLRGGGGSSDELGRSLGGVDGLLSESGKLESGSVDVLVPVLATFDVSEGSAKISVGVEGADDESDRSRGVRRDGSVGEFGDGEQSLAHLHQVGNEGKMKPEAFSLGRDGSTSLEGFLEELEVGLLEEGGGGSDGIRRIGNDYVELSLLVLEELESISNVYSDSGIGEGGGHVREVELGHSGNGFVDIAEDGRFDGRMLEDLSEDSTVSTTDDEDGDGVGVRSEREMSDHFCRRILSIPLFSSR